MQHSIGWLVGMGLVAFAARAQPPAFGDDEVAREAAGPSAGEVAREAAGPSAGEVAREAAGPSAGEVAREAAGLPAGEVAREAGRALESGRLTVLALPLVAHRVDGGLVRTIDDLVISEMCKRPSLKVTSLADIDALLQQEMLKDVTGCEDVSCSAEIGGAVGADRILVGSVGRVGEAYVLTLRWLDAVYPTALAHVSVEIHAGEAGLPRAIRQAIGELLEGSRSADDTARRHKRRPTFWTAEVSGGGNLIDAPEPYDIELHGTMRLAWGGRRRGGKVFFYGVGGLGVDYFRGDKESPTGRIGYRRLHLTPFVELRVASPIAFHERTRIYAGIGAGLAIEKFSAKQSQGTRPSGTLLFPELRGVAGVWHRWHYHHSLWAGYRLRVMFRGDGADTISELVQLGASASRFWIHAFEIGWAYHF